MARIVDLVSGDRDCDGGTDYDLDGWRGIGGLNLWWQIGAFLVVSFTMLVFTRPFVVKYINSHHEKTNYEGIIGKVVRITEKVDNLQQTGTAVVNGLEWTTRAERDDVILDPGDLAKVVNISGVKLIVKKYEEE